MYAITAKIYDFETWYKEWRNIAEVAEVQGRYIHSMYYYRMAEFMLINTDPDKDTMYRKMQEMFNKAFPTVKRHKVPFKKGYLPCIFMKSTTANKTVLLHGGYDSFIEEFYLICEQFVQAGYNVLLFEGEGQGDTLRQGMTFNEKWESSITTLLDFFELEQVALIGVSWGGYFALRAAAFEKRVTHVVCFDVCFDGLDVQMQLMKQPIRSIFQIVYKLRFKSIINLLVQAKMNRDTLANWGISHGMYITGTNTPYAFYEAIEKHTLQKLLNDIDQNVLLLAGEKDHYIPRWHFDYLKDNLPFAAVTARLFTKEEGGEQHCRVGNYDLAVGYIQSWLQRNY